MRQGYKLLRQFNAGRPFDVSSKNSIEERHLPHFAGAGLQNRFVQALARERAVPVKEVFESFEFFGRVRKHVRGPVVADLCAGHGLTGVLFALFERQVEHVVVLDRNRPPSFDRVMAAAAAIAPWVADKVVYKTARLCDAEQFLQKGASIVAIHACGLRTDSCLELGMALRSKLAVMPCCYPDAHCPAPATLLQHLGGPLAYDVDRTYRLERAGYSVKWDGIPEEITPMARILIAKPNAPIGA